MSLNYMAGAGLTQVVVVYFSVLFVSASVAAGIVIFFGKKLFDAAAKNRKTNKLRFIPAMLLGFAAAAAGVVIFFVIPTVVQDHNWQNKQQVCAKQVGYSSPIDDDSDKATAESQMAYRHCLGLE